MSNSPADILRQLLIDLSLGTDPTPWTTGRGNAWPVYATSEPNEPDNCITVTDTVGWDSGRAMRTGEVLYHYGYQIRVRATDHVTGWQKADAIRTALQTNVKRRKVQCPGGKRYKVWAAARIGEVLPLGKDTPATKRSLFTLNAGSAIDPLN